MMKKSIAIMAAIAITGAATAANDGGNAMAPIGKSDIKIEGGVMTPEALWAMGRIGEVSVSPDAKSILYGVSYYSVEQNKSHHTLNIMGADGSNDTKLTTTAANESSAAWIKGGTKIAYLSNASGSSQVWEMNPDGTERKQLTNDASDIEGFLFSPDETKVILVKRVKIKPTTADIHPDLPLAQGFVVEDLMYKHWDEWITDAPHPFIADFDGNSINEGTDMLEGTTYDCPNRPFGGTEQLAWSNDSKKIAYACIKKSGKDYTVSTDTDIYLYDTESGETTNLCKLDAARSNYGYDTAPQFSPDGNSLAWLSMKRDGYESDENRLFICNLATGEQTFLSKGLDTNVDSYYWKDNNTLVFSAVWHATSMLYEVNLQGERTCLTSGQYDYVPGGNIGDTYYCLRHSMREANEIFAFTSPIANSPSPIAQLTHENDNIYSQITDHQNGIFTLHLSGIVDKGSRDFVIYEILSSRFGFKGDTVDSLCRALIAGTSGKKFYSRSHVAYPDRGNIVIKKIEEWDSCEVLVQKGQQRAYCGNSVLYFEVCDVDSITSFNVRDNIALLDADKLQYPLRLRRWQDGDSFIPFGMTGRKKVSDFLIDRKISMAEKERQFVMISEDEIAWVVGRRISDDFRITAKTENVLRITKEII